MPKKSRSRNSYDYWPASSRPLPARDGIKARTQSHSKFGQSWWARRWIQALEQLGLGSRLQRGRSYARSGQVLTLDLEAGAVKATVQGSRPRPYNVTLGVPALTDDQWARAIEAMGQQALFTAKLLAGEMPQEIEEAFQAAGVSLMPQAAHELYSTCSCPDIANPCKHIAAVYYLLGERFDDDPFLIFALRGRTKDQIIEALRALRAAAVAEEPASYTTSTAQAPALAEQLDAFFSAGPELAQIVIEIAPPQRDAAALRALGAVPAGVDAELRQLYKRMTAHVLRRFFDADE
jgi:uncharacterized Zn finger protein